MEQSIPKIFVIVVTYKGKQWYDRCFTSLRNSTIPVQTIVVDNASNDGTVEYIRENYPEVLLIESKENLGFGKGNNLALKYAYEHGCDYVFLLNQDAWLDRDDTLERLIDLSKKYPDFGIISPIHLSADKKSLNMDLENGNNKCSMHMLNDLLCGMLNEIYQSNYVNAAAWLLPRNTLSALGGFDPLIYHYGEDDDYLNRAHYHGLKIGVCPMVTIVHDHKKEGSPQSQILQNEAVLNGLYEFLDINKPFCYHKLRLYYFRKYIKALLCGDGKLKKYFMYKFKYLKSMRNSIEHDRKMNEIKQPNWIQ